MIQKYEDFLNEEIQLNESEMKQVDDAAEIIAKNLKEGNPVDEGLFKSVVGGLTGVTIGPAIGKAICNALGITGGVLYNLFTSRAFTTAVAAYIGYKN